MSNNYNNNEPIGRTEQQPFGIQKDPKNYYHPNYLDPPRLSSYAYQFRLAFDTDGYSFLNIGSANDLLRYLLSEHGKYVINLDLDQNTHPSIAAALPFLPFEKKSFDVVMCFQMFEHMPFEMFSVCLTETMRISKSYIILSLPDATTTRSEIVKKKFYNIFHFPKEWRYYKKRQIDDEHFWEIGHSNITTETIVSIFQQHNLDLLRNFRNQLNPYHHFFLLKII